MHTKASFSLNLIDSLCLRVAQTPTIRDMAIFVLTITTTMTQLITLPLVHACGVIINADDHMDDQKYIFNCKTETGSDSLRAHIGIKFNCSYKSTRASSLKLLGIFKPTQLWISAHTFQTKNQHHILRNQ